MAHKVKTPKLQIVSFEFSGGYSVITQAPFNQWHVYNPKGECTSFDHVQGRRKDVTKLRARMILIKSLS